jgi:hypothetical protein
VTRTRGARTRASFALLLLGFFAALFAPTAVWGHDHRVPRANLHVNGQAKRLGAWTSSWVWPDGPGFCVIEHSDGVPGFGQRADVHMHSTPRIVFRKEQRPRRVHAIAGKRLEDGYPADPKRLDVKLLPRERDGARVWVAKLHARVRHKLFVDLTAHWRDVEGCGGNEEASWSFSLRGVGP